jgi:polar amino acid transport system substrate-binding protein
VRNKHSNHTAPAAGRRPGKIAAGALTAAVAATLVAAGCSSSSNRASSTPAASLSSSSASAAAPSGAIPQVAALVPSAVKAKGSVTVAMDATYPPMESIGSDGHTIIGVDADLGKALGDAMGIKWNPVNATFATIIPGLQSGKYDIGLSSFTDTKEREKVVDFVTYFQAGEAFYVKAGGPAVVTSLASLCGNSVAVESGTTEQADATAQSKKCTAEGKKAVAIQTYGNQNDANLAVSSGRAAAGFVDSQVAGVIVKQSNGVFKLSGSAIGVAPYGIAVTKTGGMATPVLAAVKAIIADGTYAQILAKWGVTIGAIPSASVVVNGAAS